MLEIKDIEEIDEKLDNQLDKVEGLDENDMTKIVNLIEIGLLDPKVPPNYNMFGGLIPKHL